jgi:hypothetical protein
LLASQLAVAQDADPLKQLAGELHARPPGVTVLMNGIDTTAALRTIVDELVAQRERRTSVTCFDFNLAINTGVDKETAEAIRQALQEAAVKIGQACKSVNFDTPKGLR